MFSLICSALLAAAPAEETPVELEPVVVEATKLPTNAQSVAATLDLISSETLEEQMAASLADIFRYTPGVEVNNQGSRFGSGGVRIRGLGGNRVAIEVDGAEISDAFSIGSFTNASRDFVDVNTLKQVEVYRGPASASYGSDAIGGIVSFVTKDPADILRGRDSALEASLGYDQISESTNARLTGAVQTSAGAGMLSYTRREIAELDVNDADPLDGSSDALLAKWQFGNASNGGLKLTADLFQGDSDTDLQSQVGVQDFTAQFGFPYVLDTRIAFAEDTRERFRLALSQQWLGGLGPLDYARWRVYGQDSETQQRTFLARTDTIGGPPVDIERDILAQYDQERLGAELNFGKEFQAFGSRHQLAFGLEGSTTDTQQMRNGTQVNITTGEATNQVGPDVFPVRDFPLSDTTEFGAYLSADFTFGNLTVSPGLRYDRFEIDGTADSIFAEDNPGITPVELTDSELSPKLGLLLDLSPISLYAQYSEGFRAPLFNDINVGFTNFQFGYTAIPNPDLVSETSQGVEVGVRYESDALNVQLAVFDNEYEDFIEPLQVVDFDPINQLLIFQSVNLGDVEIQGAELSAKVRSDRGVDVWFNAAWAEGDDLTNGVPLSSVDPLSASAGVSYAASNAWGLTYALRAQRQKARSDLPSTDALASAGWTVHDVYGHWNINRNLRLRAGIYNLFDREYLSWADVQGLTAQSAAASRLARPGRTAAIYLDWNL